MASSPPPQQPPPSSYDLLPYEDYCFPATHPEHLYCVARLLGHPAHPFARCRVLELGCARGGNLLPMALDLPDCEFVGVDLSARQIDEGNAVIARLGLRNVTLRAASITDVDASYGAFDYVVCHGVYSWVPPAVQSAIFAVSRQRLAPAGVAYVSYNTLPGWSVARTLRDYLLQSTAGASHDPSRRLAAARAALALLGQGLAAARGGGGEGATATAYTAALRSEVETLARVDDSYLFHEYLEDVNAPAYVTDVVGAARAEGLDYLCDADPAAIVRDALRAGRGDVLPLEQFVDFVRCRRFRASLFARAEHLARRAPAPEDLAAFHLATRAELAQDSTEAELRTDRPLAFELDGRRFELRAALAKCALVALVEQSRRPLAWPALCARVVARLRLAGAAAAALPARLAREADLLGMVFAGTIELAAADARYAAAPGPRPRACPLARDQAAHGAAAVTNRRHRQLDLGAPFERALLALLDGTRDRAALVRALEAQVRAGALAAPPGGDSLARACDAALEHFALNALLVG